MISIVIPTHNRIESLRRCLNSILSQYYEGLEIIIVNDCSTDLTAEYLATLQTVNPFITVINNEINHGVNYSRNRGIEKATREFILFLDSDDCLTERILPRILDILKSNAGHKHFLFLVSDRYNEFRNHTIPRFIQYNEWVGSKIGGDFVHLVRAATMKQFKFFEQFRRFEYLNWLRIYKDTSPQLLTPFVVAERERGRADSLTESSKLRNINVIDAKFESQKLYYSMYHKDLARYASGYLTYKLLQVVMLGVACNKKKECRQLVGYTNVLLIKIAASLIILLPSAIARQGIIRYSSIK